MCVSHPDLGSHLLLNLSVAVCVGQLRPSGSLVAAAGVGVWSLDLGAVSRGCSAAVICMINNLRYAQGHRSLSPDYGWPRNRADDSFSHRRCAIAGWCKTEFIPRHIITFKGARG